MQRAVASRASAASVPRSVGNLVRADHVPLSSFGACVPFGATAFRGCTCKVYASGL